MREFMVSALVLLCCLPASPQTALPDWKTIRDAKNQCQISVPPDWSPMGETSGAATFRDSTTAIAVVTSQPGQEFKPLTPAFLKTMGVPKGKMFENSATRIFYQHRIAQGPDDSNAFSSSVPGKGGTCSCHVTIVPAIPEETAKKIVLSLTPVPAKT